jgi:hypothetical protein
MLDLVEPLRHPVRTARKAGGRIRRNMSTIPQSGDILRINRAVRFEHK